MEILASGCGRRYLDVLRALHAPEDEVSSANSDSTAADLRAQLRAAVRRGDREAARELTRRALKATTGDGRSKL